EPGERGEPERARDQLAVLPPRLPLAEEEPVPADRLEPLERDALGIVAGIRHEQRAVVLGPRRPDLPSRPHVDAAEVTVLADEAAVVAQRIRAQLPEEAERGRIARASRQRRGPQGAAQPPQTATRRPSGL